jgi:hypothetical protein
VQEGYFREAAGIVKAAWAMATGADLSYPQLEASRPKGSGIMNKYIGGVISLSCSDKKVLTTWNQVTNMQRPLSALFAPAVAGRVVKRLMFGARG